MKRLFTLLFLLISLFSLSAQENEDIKLVKRLYYEFNQIYLCDAELAKLNEIVELLASDSSVKIRLDGYGDPLGGESINNRMSYLRAKAVADYLHNKNIPEAQISFRGCGVDSAAATYAEARRVDVSQIITVVIESTSEIVAAEEGEETAVATEVTLESEIDVAEETPVAEISKSTILYNFSLRTNLLYWLGGMMNIGVEYKQPDSNFGFVLNGGYSPFGDTDWSHNLGGWFVTPELRYYLPRNEQWFVGAQFLASGYNIKLSDTGYQGTVIGGGVMSGYKLAITNSLDMDFTLGVGYGHFKYDTYYHDEPTSTNPYIEKGVEKNSIMPIQAGVNLIWKIK